MGLWKRSGRKREERSKEPQRQPAPGPEDWRTQAWSSFPEANPNMVLRIGSDGTLLYANPPGREFLDAFNCREGEPVGEVLLEPTRRALRTQAPITDEHSVGQTTLLLTFAPVPDHDSVAVYGHDVTHQREAETALDASHRDRTLILNHLPLGVALIDREFRVVEMNRTMQEWFPDLQPNAHMMCCTQLEPHQPNIPPYCPVRLALQDGEVHEREVEGVREGRRVHYRVLAAPVSDDAGKVARVIQIIEETTARRSLEEQLRQSQKMEAVGQLAGGVAHDFNNLLTGIMGYAEIAVSQVEADETLQKDLQEIQRLAGSAAQLTRQLLMFSRREPEKMEPVDVGALIEEHARMLRRMIAEDIVLNVAPGRDLWPILGDSGQLGQVLVNLAVNARDAMPKGGQLTIAAENVHLDNDYVAGHIGVTTGDYVMISVEDTGTGMDRDTRERIFDPFFTTKGREEGTGLGLSTVHGIIRQHGGSIWVYSEPDEGTTFKIYLPRARRATAGEEQAPAAETDAEEAEALLIVEDDEGVRAMTQRALEQEGYHLFTASSAAEARDLALRHPEIRLVITDIVLPDGRGRELLADLRQRRPGLKALFVSGYSDAAEDARTQSGPGTDCLAKPFTTDELATSVRNLLDQS